VSSPVFLRSFCDLSDRRSALRVSSDIERWWRAFDPTGAGGLAAVEEGDEQLRGRAALARYT